MLLDKALQCPVSGKHPVEVFEADVTGRVTRKRVTPAQSALAQWRHFSGPGSGQRASALLLYLLLANLGDVFDRGLVNLPNVVFRHFKTLRIDRAEAQPIQLDGELHDAPKTLEVNVQKGQLKVLVPSGPRA